MQKLQEQALALRQEQEEKLKLLANQDAVLAMAKEADERATKKEAEMAAQFRVRFANGPGDKGAGGEGEGGEGGGGTDESGGLTL